MLSTGSHAPPDPAVVWIKADLHVHSAEDPFDEVRHDAAQLLHRAHALGFKALAITLHDHVLDRPELRALAAQLGILLVRAGEIRIEGADVVILNLSPEEAAGLKTFDDLRALRHARGDSLLTIAPHAFYLFGGSIGSRLARHIDCFDAIEYCHFHTAGLNLNRSAIAFAQRHARPLIATSDAHQLRFFGDHYSLIAMPPNGGIADLFAAIRAGRVRLVSPAWPLSKFLDHLWHIFIVHPIQCQFSRWQN